jgi:ParD-like antitoxin of type II bacterial toxin-antitoxin system
MPKSSSPVRLQDELMRSAALIGALHQRSVAQQVECWASLGRNVAGLLGPEQLLAVKAGLARLRLEPLRVAAVDPGSVFDTMEQARQKGSLAGSVTTAQDRYQASVSHPGLLERISSDGIRSVGTFEDGVFRPCDPSAP